MFTVPMRIRPAVFSSEVLPMKLHVSRCFLLALAVALILFSQSFGAPLASAQGGEPQYFAIRGAKVVPVSGPAIEDATVVVARGVILAVGGKDVPIPADALVIEGKGFIVYPGLFDSFTDVGLSSVPAPASGEGGARGGGSGQPAARGPEDRPGASPWRNAADEASVADKRVETWRNAGFTTVVSAPKGGLFPGQAAVFDLVGERNGDLVVKAPVAIPVSLQPGGGFGSGFPDSKMGVLAYVHQVWLDVDWSSKAEAAYEKNPRGMARPRYDRVNAALSDALEDHALVLIPANSSLELRRALVLVDRWKVPGVIVGAHMAYEVAPELAAKKLPVIVNLKWPEPDKDADPDDVEGYARVLALHPQDPEIWVRKGDAYRRRNEPEDAQSAYDRALRIESDRKDALEGKALAYLVQGEPQRALRCLDRLTARPPGRPWQQHHDRFLMRPSRYRCSASCHASSIGHPVT